MKLHENIKLFSDTLRATSQHLDVKPEFIEKDYWITLVLSRLAGSKYADKSVFKGGPSLSKAYNLIDRFSEDVDLAIINDKDKTGNEIKFIIRSIEKEITKDLKELNIEGVTSKGSRFRNSVFEYSTTEKNNTNNKIIVEINSFANPFPFQKCTIQSLVSEFLMRSNNEKYIEHYNLHPFELNVLNKEQTLLEKFVSLIRFSFEENTFEGLSEKIRHFYDIYFLLNNAECLEFVSTSEFKIRFNDILQHDRTIFEKPIGWQSKSITESPLLIDFLNIWKQLTTKYETELSALAYRKIPDQKDVAQCFEALLKSIE